MTRRVRRRTPVAVVACSTTLAAVVLPAGAAVVQQGVVQHEQFVRLAWSISAGYPVEQPRVVACRYTAC